MSHRSLSDWKVQPRCQGEDRHYNDPSMKYALLLTLLALGLRAESLPLRAGVARVDITPATLMPMYGYANRKCGPANGTHDPLFAKVVVLAVGDSRLAIVTLDLGSVVSENLRREVADKLGIPVLLIAASHTHSGPLYLDRSGADTEYL